MMARKLSVRKRGGGYEVGPAGHREGKTASVRAAEKSDALAKGKALLRERGDFAAAARATFRCYAKPEHGVVVDTRRVGC